MTKLTPHRCDLCDTLLYAEENTIYKLEINFIDSIAEARAQDAYLDWELCSRCYDAFLKWIQKKQEPKK